ncbi:DoxX-like family protein [Gimesia maris]|uniref:DoxX-like family protein n=1 Tax=Gimesia maris TaxID=122 RepID=UPI0032EB7E48
MGIYVETRIHGSLEELWEKTQNPECHERWDARFTSITYLPRAEESEPQSFEYATRLGFGLFIKGAGETVGSRDETTGRRTSSLRFWSDDAKSLIREGAGYWQYTPLEDGVRFVTGYDYQTRFGWLGRTFDRCVFRPLMGWATAWSFDRLRLWIEKGIDPAVSMQRTLTHGLARLAVAFVWLYQGLVPKLIARHADELAMLTDAEITASAAPTLLLIAGIAEVVLGVAVLVCFRRRWPLVLTVLLMLLATIGVAISSPQYLSAAFNPVSLNLLLAVVALLGLSVMHDLPSARRCLRKKPETD